MEPQEQYWQGRLSLNEDGPPAQSFSASFELRGQESEGSLVLYTALGTTLARIQWSAASSSLQTVGEPQIFDSLGTLVRHLTGTDLPITTLFSWLKGEQAVAQGWEADLSALANGRLRAQRMLPHADLRVILEH